MKKDLSFKEFLEKKKRRKSYGDTLYGDFVSDAVWAGDIRDFETIENLRAYLYLRRACPEVFRPAEKVYRDWKRYKAAKDRNRNISVKTRYEIFKRDGFYCQICGATAKSGSRLEIDHITPVSNGGDNSEKNLWTLCSRCNRGKSDNIYEEI